MAIIRNSILSFETEDLDVLETTKANSSKSLTIGGQVVVQGDSTRQYFEVKIRLKQSELNELEAILYDYTEDIFLEPDRILGSDLAIREYKVALDGALKIGQRSGNGSEVMYHVDFNLEEVLF